jgi:hypothetical protein
MPSASRPTSMSTVAASGQARPLRVTATSRSPNAQASLVRSQLPDNAIRSKRESTAPNELWKATSASASSTVPLLTAPPCQSSQIATSRAGLGRDSRQRKARRNGDVDAVEIDGQPPIAGVLRAGICFRGVGDERLRGDLDAIRELRRRQPSGLDRQNLVVAAQAAVDVLERPRDAARGVEIQHAAVAHEHVDLGRHLHRDLLSAHGRRSLQAVGASRS